MCNKKERNGPYLLRFVPPTFRAKRYALRKLRLMGPDLCPWSHENPVESWFVRWRFSSFAICPRLVCETNASKNVPWARGLLRLRWACWLVKWLWKQTYSCYMLDGTLLVSGIDVCQRMRGKRQKICGKMSKGFMQLDEYEIILLAIWYVHARKSYYGFKNILKTFLYKFITIDVNKAVIKYYAKIERTERIL